jgi:hypothetical protein
MNHIQWKCLKRRRKKKKLYAVIKYINMTDVKSSSLVVWLIMLGLHWQRREIM